MRLLCCGPRNLTAAALPAMVAALDAALADALPYAPGFVLAHGAARGADFLWEDAMQEVVTRDPLLWLPVRRVPAKWKRLPDGKWDRRASVLRNERMLREVQPTHWLAAHWSMTPDTPGTSDMVRRLHEAGVPGKVVLVSRPSD